jgi:DNA-binding NarL/FixJ family response regulator
MKRLLLADDHAMMLEGLISVLRDEFEIVGTAKNGRELVEQAQLLKPGLIVLDVSMPELNGIEAARRLNTLLPSAKLVFVTQQLDPAYVRAAFDAGAMGYVAKQSAGSELLEAVRLAMAGRYYVSALVTTKDPTLRPFQGSKSNPAKMFGGSLTPRQRDVLQMVAEGKTAKEISSALNISVKTVEFHRNGLMNELGLRTTAELTRYAVLHGIVSD